MTTFTTPKQSFTWLITCCSSGFGLSLVRAVLSSGRHTVVATSRNPSKRPDLVAKVECSGGRWLPLDVTDPSAGRKLIDDLEGEGVEIDVLVNNAGFSVFGPAETATEEEIRSQMEAMYFGPVRLTQATVPHMRKRRFGVVANMSSGASLMGNESMGVYAGAKAGLDVLGVFDTYFSGAAEKGSAPLPEDHRGSMAEKMMLAVTGGSSAPDGDPDKAMRAVYDVVVGEGVGKGHEAERLLPLGKDMTVKVGLARDHLQGGLNAFKEVTNNVSVNK